MARLVVEWIGNAVVALVATVAVSELLRFVVRFITDPRPDHEGELCPAVDGLLTACCETVPLPGGGP